LLSPDFFSDKNGFYVGMPSNLAARGRRYDFKIFSTSKLSCLLGQKKNIATLVSKKNANFLA
jgi:hypothetical protein